MHKPLKQCRWCGPCEHDTAGHRPYFDDKPYLRQAYLRGWQNARLGTVFPAEKSTMERERYELGQREAMAS